MGSITRAVPALLVAALSTLALTATSTTGAAAAARPATGAPAAVERWTGPSTLFRAANDLTQLDVVPSPGAIDGSALKLTLPADPDPGAAGSAIIVSDQLYRYGSFGTRMKTADCTGEDHPGVVTGAFTYSTDHADTNGNGVSDNDEIDIEFLCAQPDVVYLSIWTDYSETSNNLGEITRAINLRTGKVLSNCYIVSYGSGCLPPLAGENTPAAVPAIPGFNSAKRYRTYRFDWQPDHVTFTTYTNAGRQIVLWNYRGPESRIPSMPQSFMQNVTYTKVWDPLNGTSHNQPTLATSAYLDTISVPGEAADQRVYGAVSDIGVSATSRAGSGNRSPAT